MTSDSQPPSDDPIDRNGLSPKFWERKPLKSMNKREWGSPM